MAVPFSNSKLRVPAGFQSLLEGVAKEVLMMQPPDIYAFCAMYFESRLTMRDGGSEDPSTHAAQIEDRTYNNSAFEKPDVDASSPSQMEAATTIQTKYRQFQAKTTADEMRQEKAAVKIQSCARGFVARQKVKEMRDERQSGKAADAPGLEDELEALPAGEEPSFQATPLASSRTGGEPLDADSNLLESNRSERSARSGVSASPKASPVASPSPAPEQQLEAAEDEEGGETERKSRNFEEEGFEDGALESHRTQDDEEQQQREDEDDTARTPHHVPRDAEAGSRLESRNRETETTRSRRGTSHGVENKDGEEDEDVGAGLFDGDTPRSNKSGEDEVRGGGGGCAPDSPHEADGGEASARSAKSAVESARLEDGDSVENDEEMERAAAKIQAGFRGMKVRQELKEEKEKTPRMEDDDVENAEVELAVEEILETADAAETERLMERETDEKPGEDMDPELEMAAIKIQAGFRGMKAREEIKKQKDGKDLETADGDAEVSPEATKDGEDGEIKEEDDPELERAAAKIQAGFRGMKTRKELREAKMDEEGVEKSPGNVELEAEAASEIPSRASNRESPLDEDDKDLERAATKIQAGFRGYKTRKELKLVENPEDSERPVSNSEKPLADESEAVDVDQHPMSPKVEVEEKPEGLDDDDPALQDAAVKIQAGFRGFKARKELKENADAEPARAVTPAGEAVPLEEEKMDEEKREVEKSADDLDDPAMNQAATKIQAGFKGYKTRKEFKEKQREDAVEKIQAGLLAYHVRKNLKTPENDADENADENEAS